ANEGPGHLAVGVRPHHAVDARACSRKTACAQSHLQGRGRPVPAALGAAAGRADRRCAPSVAPCQGRAWLLERGLRRGSAPAAAG
ncbi:unnamed protein product, partial [Effrenium voratum]